MWKDFFSFSKRERVTLISLTILIILAQVMIWTKDLWVRFLPDDLEHKYQQKKELEAYRDSVSASKPTYASRQPSYEKKVVPEPLSLVPFNPNTADSVTLRRLGLRTYVVKNILNYRRKGGTFRKSSDFARIYGLEPALFSKLEPLIRLEEVTMRPEGSAAPTKAMTETPHPETVSNPSDPSTSVSAIPTVETQTFELNAADTTLLQQLKGVGSFSANRIARYRNQLGGFYSVAQLAEIKGLYPETLARLQSMLQIDPTRIHPLDVNKASLEKLRAHPYLSFFQAKVIVELRKARGNLHSLDELSAFKEFKPEDLERLKWYLRF
jgi:DNA uptake protein ComE-like DNA-binding protein